MYTCPACGSSGPFQEVIEVTSAIEVVFDATPQGALTRRVVDDAEAVDLSTALAGYRCMTCTASFDRPRRA